MNIYNSQKFVVQRFNTFDDGIRVKEEDAASHPPLEHVFRRSLVRRPWTQFLIAVEVEEVLVDEPVGRDLTPEKFRDREIDSKIGVDFSLCRSCRCHLETGMMLLILIINVIKLYFLRQIRLN